MSNNLPLTDLKGEVRELTADDFQEFKHAKDVLPMELLGLFPRRGRPLLATPKKAINIRLSDDVVTAFKATGKGWQTRINDVLRDWLKENKPT